MFSHPESSVVHPGGVRRNFYHTKFALCTSRVKALWDPTSTTSLFLSLTLLNPFASLIYTRPQFTIKVFNLRRVTSIVGCRYFSIVFFQPLRSSPFSLSLQTLRILNKELTVLYIQKNGNKLPLRRLYGNPIKNRRCFTFSLHFNWRQV